MASGTKWIRTGTYSVGFGKTGYSLLKQVLRSKKYSRIFLLLDENSHDHCLPRFIAHLPAIAGAEFIEIGSGEKNKNIDITRQLWHTLSDMGADRKSLLINLGGGVIGDMGGFVASTYMRGIDFIQVPTTLLAQVDASVGGKLGIDLGPLKNLVGTFRDPAMVLIDSSYLSTLPHRQILSGYAEILKHGLIADAEYFNTCSSSDPLGSLDETTIRRSVQIKAAVVKKDPKEQGPRKFLNFGHTVGHALESFSLESDTAELLHGEAVAAGMICAAYISSRRTGLDRKSLSFITDRISGIYKLRNFNKFDEHRVLELMLHDKKNVDGQYRFVLLKEIGNPVADVKCTAAMVKESFRYYRDTLGV
ncbi:MAG: 3-dehydroquinate synthase [Bacteroidia bacterium]|nr:3-dehydroquinate synthase [Bacteroidia bacterium]